MWTLFLMSYLVFFSQMIQGRSHFWIFKKYCFSNQRKPAQNIIIYPHCLRISCNVLEFYFFIIDQIETDEQIHQEHHQWILIGGQFIIATLSLAPPISTLVFPSILLCQRPTLREPSLLPLSFIWCCIFLEMKDQEAWSKEKKSRDICTFTGIQSLL